MGKPIRRKQPKRKAAYDIFPFGQYKGKTISWMADNHPLVLESWMQSGRVFFDQSIIDRINKAKHLST